MVTHINKIKTNFPQEYLGIFNQRNFLTKLNFVATQ
jgi:hypothetical protein